MARKLPWAVTGREFSPKRRRIEQTVPPNQDDLPPPQLVQAQDQDVITQNHGRGRSVTKPGGDIKRLRTPSTSPARGPPPQQLMYNGYQADDIYMMVEDEFQSVAQSYTAHLHQAEYKRLIREARNKPPKPLPEPTSPMSKTAKSRLKSVILQKKQKNALAQVMGTNPQDEEEEDDVVDLWSGTSLAQFMSNSSQGKTSLVGLERISSTTKAGFGFARADTGQPRLQQDHGEQSATPSTSSFSHRLKPDQNSLHPHPRSSLSVSARRQMSGEHNALPDPSTSRGHKTQGKNISKVASYLSDEDDAFSIKRHQSSDARKTHNGKSTVQDKERDRKARLAQVPMFMI